MFNKMITLYQEKTGLANPYNYLLDQPQEELAYYSQFLTIPEVRKAIHVGPLAFKDVSWSVYNALFDDLTKTIVPRLQPLLDNNYKVMFYNGQLTDRAQRSQT